MSTELSDILNVDPDEVEKFTKLASRWWDPNSEFKPLHQINPLRADFINERSPVSGKKLLDIGCGGGLLVEAMAQRGAEVTGIDMGEANLNVAKIHQLESGVNAEYIHSTAESFAETHAEQFDVVTCLEMLEHVPDPASVISACAKLVKPDGDVYFSTINRNPKAYLFAVVGGEYVLKLLPKGTHEYSKFIKPSELAKWMRDAGLQMQQSTGLTYNPVTKTYRLNDRDVSVNYMIQGKKL